MATPVSDSGSCGGDFLSFSVALFLLFLELGDPRAADPFGKYGVRSAQSTKYEVQKAKGFPRVSRRGGDTQVSHLQSPRRAHQG